MQSKEEKISNRYSQVSNLIHAREKTIHIPLNYLLDYNNYSMLNQLHDKDISVKKNRAGEGFK